MMLHYNTKMGIRKMILLAKGKIKMLLSFLTRIKDDKTRIVADILLNKGCSTEYAGISFQYIQACRAFRSFGQMLIRASDKHKVSPEKHILNMYKILFICNISFVPDMIGALTAVYMFDTKFMLYRDIKVSLNEKSIYNIMLGKSCYSKSAKVYKQIFPAFDVEGTFVPRTGIEPDIKEMEVILDDLDNLRPYLSDHKISHVAGDIGRIKLFNDLKRARKPMFYYNESTGFMVPVSRKGDDDRWLDI